MRILESITGKSLSNGIRPVAPSGDLAPKGNLDDALIAALHARGFQIAVETNGTLVAPHGIDWICVSPKAGADWLQREGHELKVVWPQPLLDLAELEAARFTQATLTSVSHASKRCGSLASRRCVSHASKRCVSLE